MPQINNDTRSELAQSKTRYQSIHPFSKPDLSFLELLESIPATPGSPCNGRVQPEQVTSQSQGQHRCVCKESTALISPRSLFNDSFIYICTAFQSGYFHYKNVSTCDTTDEAARQILVFEFWLSELLTFQYKVTHTHPHIKNYDKLVFKKMY